MEIKKEYLTTNKYSRPGNKINTIKGSIVHWVANPNTSAMANKNYFEGLKIGKK